MPQFASILVYHNKKKKISSPPPPAGGGKIGGGPQLHMHVDRLRGRGRGWGGRWGRWGRVHEQLIDGGRGAGPLQPVLHRVLHLEEGKFFTENDASEFTFLQCRGSGSRGALYFWASRIRIQILVRGTGTDPDPSRIERTEIVDLELLLWRRSFETFYIRICVPTRSSRLRYLKVEARLSVAIRMYHMC